MINVKIIADSVAPTGARLTTFVLTYPRFIHAEFMTHRVFSRNASSSRAIPVKKSIQEVIDNPVIPMAFTKNKPGMQGGEALTGEQEKAAIDTWLAAMRSAVLQAQALADLDVHKQYANRILEPFAHITVVCSATEWTNWFALRYHPMAQPEICELAKQMWEAYSANKPISINEGEWHLPFIDSRVAKDTADELVTDENGDKPELEMTLVKRSVARCARVSYLTHEGTEPSLEQDLNLYNRLLGSQPVHASPAEHQAQATGAHGLSSGNFKNGWIQYRQTIVGQNITEFTGPIKS